MKNALNADQIHALARVIFAEGEHRTYKKALATAQTMNNYWTVRGEKPSGKRAELAGIA
jgi:hypothetical protein